MSPQESHRSLTVVNIQRHTNDPHEPTQQIHQQLFKTYVKYKTQDYYTQNHLYRLKNIVVVKYQKHLKLSKTLFSPDGGRLT